MDKENKKLRLAIEIYAVVTSVTAVVFTFVFWSLLSDEKAKTNLGVMAFLIALMLAPFTIIMVCALIVSIQTLINRGAKSFKEIRSLTIFIVVILAFPTLFALNPPFSIWKILELIIFAMFVALLILMTMYKTKIRESEKREKQETDPFTKY